MALFIVGRCNREARVWIRWVGVEVTTEQQLLDEQALERPRPPGDHDLELVFVVAEHELAVEPADDLEDDLDRLVPRPADRLDRHDSTRDHASVSRPDGQILQASYAPSAPKSPRHQRGPSASIQVGMTSWLGSNGWEVNVDPNPSPVDTVHARRFDGGLPSVVTWAPVTATMRPPRRGRSTNADSTGAGKSMAADAGLVARVSREFRGDSGYLTCPRAIARRDPAAWRPRTRTRLVFSRLLRAIRRLARMLLGRPASRACRRARATTTEEVRDVE